MRQFEGVGIGVGVPGSSEGKSLVTGTEGIKGVVIELVKKQERGMERG